MKCKYFRPALRALARDDCLFRAFLRFARALYAGTLARGAPGAPGAPGANTARSVRGVVGDLRYYRSPGSTSRICRSIARRPAEAGAALDPPRSDLFGPLE